MADNKQRTIDLYNARVKANAGIDKFREHVEDYTKLKPGAVNKNSDSDFTTSSLLNLDSFIKTYSNTGYGHGRLSLEDKVNNEEIKKDNNYFKETAGKQRKGYIDFYDGLDSNKKTMKTATILALDSFISEQLPIARGNYQKEILIDEDERWNGDHTEAFGLKNADLYDEINKIKEKNKSETNKKILKGTALSIVGAVGTVTSGGPILATLSGTATLDTILSTAETYSDSKKVEKHLELYQKMSQSDTFKTLTLSKADKEITVREFQNIDGAILLTRKTKFKSDYLSNNDGEINYKDFLANERTSNNDYGAITSDESYHYELNSDGKFYIKYLRNLTKYPQNMEELKDQRYYELKKFNGSGFDFIDKEDIDLKIAMNIFEGYDNGYDVMSQLDSIYNHNKLGVKYQYPTEEKAIESDRNLDIDFYIPYHTDYRDTEKKMYRGWSENLNKELKDIKKDLVNKTEEYAINKEKQLKIKKLKKERDKIEDEMDEVIKKMKENWEREPDPFHDFFFTPKSTPLREEYEKLKEKRDLLKKEIRQYPDGYEYVDLDKRYKAILDIHSERKEAIDNKLKEFYKITGINYQDFDFDINEYNEKVYKYYQSDEYKRKAEEYLNSPTTQGEADLNYLKENHLTDSPSLNPETAFSLDIDGMALDQSLLNGLNYGIDASKLVDYAGGAAIDEANNMAKAEVVGALQEKLGNSAAANWVMNKVGTGMDAAAWELTEAA